MISKLSCLLLATLIWACAKTEPDTSDPATAQESVAYQSIAQLGAAYRGGEMSVAAAVEMYLARVAALDESFLAVIAINPDAKRDAVVADSLFASGIDLGPLHGVPVWLKDNIDDIGGGLPTTAGARVLADSGPRNSSAVAEQLRAAGAIILGKTNLSEWANFHSSFSSSGHSGVGGQTGNAYDVSRSPCGSSAGSAVAVALGYAPVAIGTETNGSIVCPSHANGLVGIKPTVGLVSRRGVVPISESQDTPGPMARTVADAAVTLNVLQGVDPADSFTGAAAEYVHRDYTAALADQTALLGKRIGLHTGPLGNHYRVDTLVRQTVRMLEAAGAEVFEIERIGSEPLGRATFDILLYEFKDGLNAYLQTIDPTHRGGYDSLGAIVAAVDASSEDMANFDHDLLRQANAKGPLTDQVYLDARRKASRVLGKDGIDRIVDSLQLDAIMAPTGGPAWKIDLVNGDNFSLGSSTPAAVTGYPNITVPMGQIDGLPVGISFFGPAWSEPKLIEVASAWEDLRGPFARPVVE